MAFNWIDIEKKQAYKDGEKEFGHQDKSVLIEKLGSSVVRDFLESRKTKKIPNR